MRMILSVCTAVVLAALLTGCATSTPKNNQGTGAQALLSQANYTVVRSAAKGDAEMTFLGIRMLGGEPFGIVLTGDKDLTTVAMNNLRQNAQLAGKSRALVNVTEELQYDPWFIIWHRVRKTITADVVEFTK